MLLGLTETSQERNRIANRKRIGVATATFLSAILLPFAIYALFHFGLIQAKSPFNAEIQEPVAQVITGTGTGTAFLISPTTLLTARHVLQGKVVGEQVEIFFEQSKSQLRTQATIKYIAPTDVVPEDRAVPLEYFLTDVAVLQVSEITDIQPLVLGESDVVQNLDAVILIGYPGGDYSITKGNINSTSYHDHDLFKLDAASNPGNSGGPCLLEDDHTVIGILVGSSQTAQEGENVALKIGSVGNMIIEKIN